MYLLGEIKEMNRISHKLCPVNNFLRSYLNVLSPYAIFFQRGMLKPDRLANHKFFGSWVIVVRPDLNRIRSDLIRLN